MMTFDIPASVLKAAVMCAPVKHDDRRVYMNGVHIGRTFDGRASVTATDGHVLFRYVVGEYLSKDFPGEGAIIPLDAVKSIKASKRQMEYPVTVALDGEESMLAFSATGMRVMFAPLVGKFPDIVGLWPENVDPGLPAIYVDPVLVKRAVDALALAGANWWFRYSKECLFLSGECGVAHAIVMGMRCKNEYRRPVF